MKKLIVVLFWWLYADTAWASQQVYESVNSTATVTYVTCSTGTTTRMDYYDARTSSATLGYNRIYERIHNQDSADDVYIGFDSRTSTSASSGFGGERLDPDDSANYNYGRNIQFWCIAEDSAGAAGVKVSFHQSGE